MLSCPGYFTAYILHLFFSLHASDTWMWPKQPEFPVAASTSLPLWNRPNTTTEYDSFLFSFSFYLSWWWVFLVSFNALRFVSSFVKWFHQTANTPRSMTWFSTATSKFVIDSAGFWITKHFYSVRGSFWLSLSLYRKHFVAPALSEGFTEILQIHFVPNFKDSESETLFRQFSEGWLDRCFSHHWYPVNTSALNGRHSHVPFTIKLTYITSNSGMKNKLNTVAQKLHRHLVFGGVITAPHWSVKLTKLAAESGLF